MRVTAENRLPVHYDVASILNVLRNICTQLNLLSEGFLQGKTNATTAAPTTGTYRQGDFVANSSPSEAGAGGSKYIITGWICTVGGTPGTWCEARVLTGN